MEASKKKDSVFSGIFPSSEPAPAPEPVARAPRPAVSEEQVSAINKKIELMERNIVERLDKRISEQAPPPPPPPPSGLAPAVITKITEMEARLKDFQDKFLIGASQMKNIEESKISARREIEELLKVVREQQKYSELDRQMHDQLEKAWARVEEMEKRMLDVYAAAAKKPAEPAAPTVSPSEIAAAVLKAVDAKLEERLAQLESILLKNADTALKTADARLEERIAPLEIALKNAAARFDAVPALVRGVEGSMAGLSSSVAVGLAGLSSEMSRLHTDTAAEKKRVEEVLAEIKKDLLSSVGAALAEGKSGILKYADSAANDGRERLYFLEKLITGHMDELAARGRSIDSKIEALEHYSRAESEKTLSAVSCMQSVHEKSLCAHIDAAAAKIAAENAGQIEKTKEAYGLAVSSAAIDSVAENISEIEARLGGVQAGLKTFVKALEPVNFDSVLGVSGAIVRSSFESAARLAAGLDDEVVLLARARAEIEANLKRLAPKPAGEGK